MEALCVSSRYHAFQNPHHGIAPGLRDGKLAIEISGVVYGEIVEALLQEVADGLLIGMKMKTHLAARYGAAGQGHGSVH